MCSCWWHWMPIFVWVFLFAWHDCCTLLRSSFLGRLSSELRHTFLCDPFVVNRSTTVSAIEYHTICGSSRFLTNEIGDGFHRRFLAIATFKIHVHKRIMPRNRSSGADGLTSAYSVNASLMQSGLCVALGDFPKVPIIRCHLVGKEVESRITFLDDFMRVATILCPS